VGIQERNTPAQLNAPTTVGSKETIDHQPGRRARHYKFYLSDAGAYAQGEQAALEDKGGKAHIG